MPFYKAQPPHSCKRQLATLCLMVKSHSEH